MSYGLKSSTVLPMQQVHLFDGF